MHLQKTTSGATNSANEFQRCQDHNTQDKLSMAMLQKLTAPHKSKVNLKAYVHSVMNPALVNVLVPVAFDECGVHVNLEVLFSESVSNGSKSFETLARVQSQIQSRRIRMSEENQALQRQLLQKRAKELANTQIGGKWDASLQSKEQIEANLLSKYEAAMLFFSNGNVPNGTSTVIKERKIMIVEDEIHSSTGFF
ncbi:hypothetical protein Vadar_007881 [Vaccinium darrowii]|uniref:Uncharacterized protein n=1 Tax=Vaccinium darrowii TaxID=229202 RepID=A0ACB7ZHU0_9ERIC|nr:hypothetical protein Vadar_007881 [Vaccinium darrowii]